MKTLEHENMKTQKQEKKSVLEFDINIFGVSLTQKALLARHLSVMIQAGLTLSEAFAIIQSQARGKLKKILGKVLLSVRSGQSLSDSFARYPKVFSGFFINVVRSGELSGTLAENLSNIAEQLEKDNDLRAKIKGAMYYPIIVTSAAFVMGLAMSFFVLPKITPLFEGLKTELPLSTQALIWFSKLIRDHGSLLILGIAIFIAFFVWFIKQKSTRFITHWIALQLPVVKNIIRNSNLARFCRTLATLLKSGLNIDEALVITQATLSNYYFQQSLDVVSLHVSKGGKISGSLKEFENLYPQITTQMIKVGEESGELEKTLFYLAEFYDKEVDNTTKSLATLIEPVLLIGVGLVVAFLALSIITPIYEITGSIKR